MPSKIQAKSAIDNAATSAKSDIDTILPSGVNIIDGNISFGPLQFMFVLNAGGILSTAEQWIKDITNNLTIAGRSYEIQENRGRRKDDPSSQISGGIIITSGLAIYRIVNFSS